MQINFKVRAKNKSFWLAFIPAVLLLVQVVFAPFGYNWDYGVLNQQLAAIINALFAVLSIVGVVTDPTTKGFSDSTCALSYTMPAVTGNPVTDGQNDTAVSAAAQSAADKVKEQRQ